MNFGSFSLGSILSLLPVIITALAQQSATVPVTVGAQHFLVAIVRNSAAGHTSWTDAMQIVLHVLGGQPGSFTVGVFSITVTPLQVAATSAASPAPAAGNVPNQSFTSGPR